MSLAVRVLCSNRLLSMRPRHSSPEAGLAQRRTDHPSQQSLEVSRKKELRNGWNLRGFRESLAGESPLREARRVSDQ